MSDQKTNMDNIIFWSQRQNKKSFYDQSDQNGFNDQPDQYYQCG